MKKIKKFFAVALAMMLLITSSLQVKAEETEPTVITHKKNHAYLPFGWVSNDRKDSFISKKLDLVASYGIDTVYVSLGTITVSSSGTLKNHMAEKKSEGLWEHIGQWMKCAEEKGIAILPIVNCNLNETFLETNPNTQETYAQEAKSAMLSVVSEVVNTGFVYEGNAYYPSGVHFDCEPFQKKYQSFYLEMLKGMREILGEKRTLSSATPAANGNWKDSYLAEVGACLDTINPMIYDSNGPSAWGNLEGGVTQNSEEYIQLVENTCLWYSEVFEQYQIDCQIVPTTPSYPDASTERAAGGWPDEESTTVWYHLSTIENMANCIKGVQRANANGAEITNLGIWNFYYFCGDAKEYQNEVNGFYSPEADQMAWLSWVKGNLLTEMEYSDSLAELENPERGFYRPRMIRLTNAGCGKVSIPATPLVHLRFGIAALSPKNNDGKEPVFSEQMLADISNILNTLRENGQTTVLRFAYDDFEGTKDMEPSMESIETHISQLAPVFQEYQDVIASVEAGFIGPWGEMHSSAMAEKEVFNGLIDALLAATPETIGITVRQPQFFANWAGIAISEIDKYQAEEGTDAYRVGVFNDGYLGSASDLGTYRNREKEVAWLSDQATHTLFGGEAVLSNGDRTYNNIDFISTEMFKTHTSYLNIEWNNILVGYWQNETYEGKDICYYGQTAFKYISDHLGYRFVLRSAALPAYAAGKVNVDFAIMNVGCGNIVKPKQVEFLFVQNGDVFSSEAEIDAREWLSEETEQMSVEVPIPQEIKLGECDVYLRVSNDCSALTGIQFANDEIWEELVGGNYIGTFEVVEQVAVVEPEEPEEPEDSENPEEPPKTEPGDSDTNGSKPEDSDTNRPNTSGGSEENSSTGATGKPSNGTSVKPSNGATIRSSDKNTTTPSNNQTSASEKETSEEQKENLEGKLETEDGEENMLTSGTENANVSSEGTKQEKTEKNCACMCHSKGIKSFIWKIVQFFAQLFGVNEVCRCGAAHY